MRYKLKSGLDQSIWLGAIFLSMFNSLREDPWGFSLEGANKIVTELEDVVKQKMEKN